MIVEIWTKRETYRDYSRDRVILYIFKKDNKILGGRICHLKGNKRWIPKYKTFLVNNSDHFSISNPILEGYHWALVRVERFTK